MNPQNKSKKVKIAIITNIPTPYRQKQWEYYSKSDALDITIFYCAKLEEGRHWSIDSAEGVKEIFLRGLTYKSLHFNPGVLKVIFKDFDMFLVGGYGYPSVIMSILSLKLLKKPWAMFIDGVSPLSIEKENYGGVFKEFLVKGADAYFANGTVGSEYLKSYGITPERIFNQYMTVDVDYFKEKGKNASKFRNEIRQKYHVDEDTVLVIYSGRLVEYKGVQDLIEAIKILKNKGDAVKALIVGDGIFKEDLMELSRDVAQDVIFAGHVDPTELHRYYYASDVFVLPTHNDSWGLVVNEAMACCLPVIVTDAAGCCLDLIQDNGFVIKHGDVSELSHSIGKMLDKEKREIFGINSLNIISRWTYKYSLKSLLKLLEQINVYRKDGF